jgi:phosphatidylglycerophosphate synthase
MVAVEGGKRSSVGELFNEAPDRVSDAATLVGAGYAAGAEPVWGWAAACVALFVAYVRALAKTAGAPNDFCGPMAKQHRMALMTVAALYVAAAPADWRPKFGAITFALTVIVVGGLATAVRRLVRAARFLRGAR